MIDNPRSPRVRAVAKLAKRSARSETGLFLLEGPQAVSEAVDFGDELLVDLFATPAARERHGELLAAAERRGVETETVSEAVLAAMADTVTPQGVVAVARQLSSSLDEILAASPRLVAVLEEIRDPGNAGTIMRAADAAGADAVLLTGRSVDVYNPKVVRSTTGSLFHLPFAQGLELEPTLARLRDAGLQVLAADIDGGDLLELRGRGMLGAPTAWLFGNEARGLLDEHVALADQAVTVPIYGRAESLNLATAASVCLYESAFAQRSA
ncbi:TrmH family RNA methyltransferase [Homoserinibacter sp. YIM 151385]|uniref:TrmH family RNA methyltransferase n=1 Tax=Homoserinibacter sp. YIM 151385 TaxID=2985506 RepID=UPI0022F0629C|nr:RNA methyltransferase [Homoserinibacter sp. YIM 151385]WBU38877.1 RNA methyltransferase [Homoserinibacter sp. YIM 151385]